VSVVHTVDLDSKQVKTVFEATIRYLEEERIDIMRQLAPLQERLREVQRTQAILLKRISPEAAAKSEATTTTTSSFASLIRHKSQRYAYISVRWAILDLLNGSEGMSTAEIAEALTAGGIRTRAANFANNVSSVLTSTMQRDHGEVEALPDSKWKLTQVGLSAIRYLQTTEKFQRAIGI
jgi:hypothetical protein